MGKKNLNKAKGHQKEQKEFEEEVLQIDRVTRVVKGGRRLRFRATVAIGDKKGRVGIGVGKASEVVTGIKKAVTKAKKDLIKVPITDGDTIPHEINFKYKSARLIILPASSGTGVIAGGSLRKILNLAGIKNVLSKNIGTRNALVVAQASIEALKTLRPLRSHDKKKSESKVEVKTTEKEDKKVESEKKDEKKPKIKSQSKKDNSDK
ncbi:30S ribosomal protein S5 [Candidatus Peregrinibacteria bacterium]|nr:30S ribosomal protein S5 [Candidatus Peregrinibacteria bacterium]